MTELQPTPERSPLTNIFLSTEEPRLRAGWRIGIHTLGYNLLLICLTIPMVVPILFMGIPPDNLLLNNAINIFAVTISVFLARYYLDKRSITSLGLKLDVWLLLDVLAGVLISFLMMGVIFLIEWTLGWMTFEGFAWETDAISSVILNSLMYLGILILGGWNEELLFRGYRLQNISEGLKTVWGVLLSSLWFGIVHLLNPNVSAILFVLSGIFLAGWGSLAG